jgi:hypothetical protein
MAADKRSGRERSRLPRQLDHSLSAYAAAAAAAGVSVLALAKPVDAKIVYTPADIPVPPNGKPFPLDLNHDGQADFSFVNVYGALSSGIVFALSAVAPNKSNGMWGRGMVSWNRLSPHAFASALRNGAKVGPKKSYFRNGSPWLMNYGIDSRYWSTTFGQWLNTHDRYLGLRFMIDGQPHFGWARFKVSLKDKKAPYALAVTLTGYAYETIPNNPIIAGKTSGPDVEVVEPASLGRLAQGAAGMTNRRADPKP